MNIVKRIVSACVLGAIMTPYVAVAADGNWKTGRLYYRMVCTACHAEQAGGSIAPSTKTMEEWGAYLAADSHAGGKDTVSHYVSRDYRESIKDTNRAAAKFLEVPADDLAADIKAFVMRGAKDGPSPARCN